MFCYFFPDTSSFCLRQCRIKLNQLDMQKGGAGGVRALSGRKPDPIWHDFETIRTPENLAKPAPNRLFKCKFCAQTVSARVERLKKHKKECGVWSAAPVVNDSNAKKVKYNHFSHLALFIIIILSYS